ncbi:site-specific integrase [Enterococcus plantarum]|uniref:Site-specific integrase n=1 Tax=Enterococcus plantarum TaxID=1077675 RepID=A0A2W3Z6Z5_9ENTE|nr:site-specific integrase [Enterococcus plantarum]PZL72187.1 site-specific integrase [Enterococcus plantarum]
MAKTSNVYKDKKTGKFYFVANLGVNEKGKRVQKFKRGFKTASLAKKAYHDFMKNYDEELSKKISFETFFETIFLKWYKNHVKENTYERVSIVTKKHFKYFYGKTMEEISILDVQEFQNYLVEEYVKKDGNSLSKQTVNSLFMNLSSVFERAVIMGIIKENIVKKIGKVREEKVEVKFWTYDEFKLVMSKIEDDYLGVFKKTAYSFLFMTGLRIGEMSALSWSDINFDDAVVTVNKTLVYKNKKNYKITTPKSKSSIRKVSFDKKTLNQLRIWKRLQETSGLTKFVFSYDGEPVGTNVMGYWLDGYADSANIHQIKIHGLRHSYASFLISLGIEPLIIKRLLGHSKISMTLDFYGHLYPESENDVVRRIESLG